MKNLLMTFMLAFSILLVQAQNTNQNNNQRNQQAGQANREATTVKQDKVPGKVLNTFKQNFSSAKNVTWSKYRNYYEASFTQDKRNYNVAITPNGEWIQTSITASMDELPSEVKEQLKSSEYANYEVRNVREVSSTGIERIYLVEVVSVEQNNEPLYLYYQPTGTLYRVGSNPFVSGSPVVRNTEAKELSREELPPNVENAFMEIYPEVTDIRWRKEKNRYIGEYSNKGKRMYFITSEEGEWQETASEYNFQQLPQTVQDAYNKAQYKDWQIYNIEYVTPAYAGESEEEKNETAKYKIHMYKMDNENNYSYKSLTYDHRGNLLNVDQ